MSQAVSFGFFLFSLMGLFSPFFALLDFEGDSYHLQVLINFLNLEFSMIKFGTSEGKKVCSKRGHRNGGILPMSTQHLCHCS